MTVKPGPDAPAEAPESAPTSPHGLQGVFRARRPNDGVPDQGFVAVLEAISKVGGRS